MNYLTGGFFLGILKPFISLSGSHVIIFKVSMYHYRDYRKIQLVTNDFVVTFLLYDLGICLFVLFGIFVAYFGFKLYYFLALI